MHQLRPDRVPFIRSTVRGAIERAGLGAELVRVEQALENSTSLRKQEAACAMLHMLIEAGMRQMQREQRSKVLGTWVLLFVLLTATAPAQLPVVLQLPGADGAAPPVVFMGDLVYVELTPYQGHPAVIEWRWYEPGSPPGGPADAAGFAAFWEPETPGVWTLHARVFYSHEWPVGQLYRTNPTLDVLVIDPMPFADGFECGDASAWSTSAP